MSKNNSSFIARMALRLAIFALALALFALYLISKEI